MFMNVITWVLRSELKFRIEQQELLSAPPSLQLLYIIYNKYFALFLTAVFLFTFLESHDL